MKLTVLGSGTPKPSSRRANSSYLLEVGEDRVLFDHGFGAGQRLVELDVEIQSISHVFLSHHHYDHIGDVARLVLTRWDQMRDDHPELCVFGPPPLAKIMERLIGEDGAFAPDLRARIDSACSRDLYRVRGGIGVRSWPSPEVNELTGGDEVDRQEWSVRSVSTIHCPDQLQCLGYRIDAGGQSLVYSGDTGPSKELVELAEGCDVFIHMCSQRSGHIATPAIAESVSGHLEAARAAAKAGAKLLLLTHIEHLEAPDIREQTLEEIAHEFGGECLIAEDLMTFDLARREGFKT